MTRYVIHNATGEIVSQNVADAFGRIEEKLERAIELMRLISDARGPRELEQAQAQVRRFVEQLRSNGHT